MKQAPIPKGLKYPTENCRYLARDGFFYKNILESPDALKKEADTRKLTYVQRPKKPYEPK